KLLAECYLNVNKLDDASKVLSILRKEYPNDPYAYVELGKLEKERGNIERATKYFAKASSLDPENMDSVIELGILLFELKKYPESLTTLQTVLTKQPDDPTVNYYLGELRVIYDNLKEAFNHFLKAKKDPRYALNSLLNVSRILRRYDKLDDARRVLTSVLKFPDLKKDEIVETRYQLGETCLAQKDVRAAIEQWEKLLTYVKDYKDVKAKLEKYEQTKTSSVIRTYMMASRSEFTEICKKAATHAAERVIIIRTEPQADSSIEIFTQAAHHDVPTTILFKFFRGSSKIGQLAIREFYEKLKDIKAKLGICFTTADYSDEAVAFSSGRVIELRKKNDLVKLLRKALKKAPSSSK
ncbi:MAG: tetratricopeptide repeat protein, partial [Spirochaetes bacterium]|nr:tetratricopeptide repeat protein [Spirochaetota bacterium]